MQIDKIKEIIDYFEKTSLSKMELKYEDLELNLEKVINGSPVTTCQEVEKTSLPLVEETGNLVKSPLVGIFYEKPSPEDEPFVRVGDTVKKGQVLCIVEAMKIMNEIKSPFNGKVKEIKCPNEATVEYDQVMFVIE